MKFSELPYQRPNMSEMQDHFDELLKDFDQQTQWQSQFKILEKINSLRIEFESQRALAEIRYTQNTEDPIYQKENDFMDESQPIYQDMVTRLSKAMISSPCRKELEQQLGTQMFRLAESQARSFSTELLEDAQEENRLTSAYTSLLASAKIDFQGETRNLSQLTPFHESPDREIRRESYQAYYGFFQENGEELDSIFDRLVKLRHTMAQKLGFSNFIPLGYLRMNRVDYGPEDVAQFRGAVQCDLVPLSVELRQEQWKRIGVEDPKIWDKSYKFLSGNPTPKGDAQWQIEQASRMYRELSPETGAFFQSMMDGELMDLETRKGKAGGGYCDILPKFDATFIFSNFNGTSGDVDVLTHECGHAFQTYQSRHLKWMDYFFPTYEACEVHSMSMEFFAWPWMKLFFKDEAKKYHYKHLSDRIQFIPYGVSVDEFQHEIYRNPELSPLERHGLWRSMEKKYQPDLDHGGIERLEMGGFWQRQTHIYRMPFYYIDYTLAQSCALNYWSWSRKNPQEAWQSYLNLCSLGGAFSFRELLDKVGLNSPFKEETFSSILPEAEAWLASQKGVE